MSKRFYYCHYCEKGTEAEENTGKAVYCRFCGRLINLTELAQGVKTAKKTSTKRKKKE